MKAKLLPRIAAILMLLHTIGHSFGAIGWKKAPNATVAQVINAMQSVHFNFMGRSASFGSFYEGYGVSMIFVLLLITTLLWLLSNDSTNVLAKPITSLLSAFLFLLAVAEYTYFFPFAAAFSLVAGICALLARIKMAEQR